MPDPSTKRSPRRNTRPRLPEPPAGYVTVGRVAGAWGLHGEMKVDPLTDFPERFAPGSRLWLAGEPRTVAGARTHQRRVLLHLEGFERPEDVRPVAGQLLVVPEGDLAELPEDTYYRYQLVGLDVFDLEGTKLGRVTDLLETGSNDVFVVRGDAGEWLVPAIGDVVREVDVPGRRITIEVIEGLTPEERKAPKPRRPRSAPRKPRPSKTK